MGQHYLPQSYLRRFEVHDRPRYIWQADKQTSTIRQVPIKDVAQKRGFYEPDIERQLNEKIEIPGNRVMLQLLERNPISEAEARTFR